MCQGRPALWATLSRGAARRAGRIAPRCCQPAVADRAADAMRQSRQLWSQPQVVACDARPCWSNAFSSFQQKGRLVLVAPSRKEGLPPLKFAASGRKATRVRTACLTHQMIASTTERHCCAPCSQLSHAAEISLRGAAATGITFCRRSGGPRGSLAGRVLAPRSPATLGLAEWRKDSGATRGYGDAGARLAG